MKIKLAFFFCLILCSTQPLLCMKKRARTISGQKEQVSKPEKKKPAATRYGQAVDRMATKMVSQELSLHHVEPQDAKKLKIYLAAGADVHEVIDGETPLHKFVRARNSDGIQKLLLYGAALVDFDGKGDSPLHMSARTLPDIAKLLLTSPQGSPNQITQEIAVWKMSIIYFSLVCKQFGVPKEVRLIICKQMMPEPNQVINWVPLPKLPYFLGFYSEQEKRQVLELLVKRHIVDIFQALRIQNRKQQTPYQVALSRVGRMGTFVPPVHLLNRNNSSGLQPEIRRYYARLLGLP